MPVPKDPQKYEEWRRKQSESHKGQKTSDEVRAKRAEIMRQRRQDPAYMEKLMNGIKNREMTEDYRQKISRANKGRKLTEERKRQISEAGKGRKVSDETKQKMSEAHIGNTYGSMLSKESRRKAAERITKLHEQHRGVPLTPEHRQKLSQAFRGNEKLKAATKAHWDSLSEEERSARINKALDATSNKPSSLEDVIAALLTTLNIEHERQYRISRYFADIFIPDKNLVIECNGCWWHCCEACGIEDREGRRAKEEKRLNTITGKGYKIAILWEHAIKEDALAVLLAAI